VAYAEGLACRLVGLSGGHVHNSRWEFTPEEADQLAAEFSGGGRARSLVERQICR
jgi:hypothetical protein